MKLTLLEWIKTELKRINYGITNSSDLFYTRKSISGIYLCNLIAFGPRKQNPESSGFKSLKTGPTCKALSINTDYRFICEKKKGSLDAWPQGYRPISTIWSGSTVHIRLHEGVCNSVILIVHYQINDPEIFVSKIQSHPSVWRSPPGIQSLNQLASIWSWPSTEWSMVLIKPIQGLFPHLIYTVQNRISGSQPSLTSPPSARRCRPAPRWPNTGETPNRSLPSVNTKLDRATGCGGQGDRRGKVPHRWWWSTEAQPRRWADRRMKSTPVRNFHGFVPSFFGLVVVVASTHPSNQPWSSTEGQSTEEARSPDGGPPFLSLWLQWVCWVSVVAQSEVLAPKGRMDEGRSQFYTPG
jgi:hypothetical protein